MKNQNELAKNWGYKRLLNAMHYFEDAFIFFVARTKDNTDEAIRMTKK